MNIFVITLAVDFRGTQVVSGLMLLGNVYLLAWDYDRWKGLLPRNPGERHLGTAAWGWWEPRDWDSSA